MQMRRTSNRFVVGVLLLAAALMSMPTITYGAGKSYYVSVNGNDKNDGLSVNRPLATINRAVMLVKPGDTIYVRGGTHRLERTVSPTVSGTASQRITLRSYGNEKVVIDASNANNGDEGTKALRFDNVAYWTVSKINVTKAPGFGISIQNKSHDIRIESLDTHHNGGTGLQIETGAYNNYINAVNSYFNYDEKTGGEHADGFANKSGAHSNIFNRCKAWNNSDDGWDFWGGGNSQVTKSEAFNNGFDANGKPFPEGDGNGFKLGGHSAGGWSGNVTVRTSLAYNNYATGFLWNGASRGNTLLNTTAYNNNRGRLSYAYNYRFENNDIIQNSISAGTGGVKLAGNVSDSYNSWNLGLDQAMFKNTDMKSREFLYLNEKSYYRNKGKRVGLSAHELPDLGAFEFGREWRE
ncbi:hypothetical protein DNH61_09675 [Paenibacillus sambharensis]|uniref:Right handed beta helix domain-containing protein n=2 Tax=Paenibacillus sambharensis TaxID=1803190 RepID=A0A2W1LMQ0_9BACL|nr:hypothetical protein DNH61_09675 [Paenibacillus sambharensis]